MTNMNTTNLSIIIRSKTAFRMLTVDCPQVVLTPQLKVNLAVPIVILKMNIHNTASRALQNKFHLYPHIAQFLKIHPHSRLHIDHPKNLPSTSSPPRRTSKQKQETLNIIQIFLQLLNSLSAAVRFQTDCALQ